MRAGLGPRVSTQPAKGPLTERFRLWTNRGRNGLRIGPTALLIVAQGLDHLVEEVVDLPLVVYPRRSFVDLKR